MISVLMCTYNREKYLKRAIDSVLNQTYGDFELVIIDDGSTDNSRELIESYSDNRIKYFRLEQNSFYCYAANYGLKRCKGDYVAFMNSDDEWLPHKLKRQIDFMQKNLEYGACFSTAYLIDNDGNDITDLCTEMRDLFAKRFDTQKEWMKYFLHCSNCLCHPTALIRKEELEDVGGFNLLYCQLADYDLWIRLVTKKPIYVFEERMIKFRWDIKKKNQISGATEGNMARSYNEQIMIRRDMVERLTDEQMKTFFGDEFKNPNSSSHLEIEFEKAFLLATCMEEAPDWKILGIDKMEKVLRLPGAMEMLREHFNMSIFDIYEWNKTHMYRDPWILNAFNNQKNEIEIYKAKVEMYETSKSWKITAPLRSVMKKIRR